jgi:hypothetical protein
MSPFFKTVIVGALQFAAGQILAFALTVGLGLGNGAELVALPLGSTLGVWGVGQLAARWGAPARGSAQTRLISTAIGSAIGAVILALPGVAFGFAGLLLPLAAALLGYYAPALRRAPETEA